MTKLEQIEQAIASLNGDDLMKLEDWLADYRFAQWDKQIESDVDSGKLDGLIAQARAEVAAGKTRPR